MAPFATRRHLLRLAATLLPLLLGSCRSPESVVETDLRVHPEFEAFWQSGGGLATFGPPIAAARTEAGQLRQTFLAVEMIRDGGTVGLAPLGWELGLAEPPVPPRKGREGDYFPETGHTLYAGFALLHARLGGVEVVGAPITEAVFGDGRIIQYFENLGMVRPENSSPADVRLVALGLTARPPVDAFGLDPESLVLRGRIRRRPFDRFLADLGGEALFGPPLSEPYLADDGALEQVYERAVVFSPDGSTANAALRPLGVALGPTEPAAPPSSEAGGLYFEQTGHNVQWAFADFYRQRDGRRWLGLPLAEAVFEDDRIRQRFETAVLEYRYDLPPGLAVQLAPLGRDFLADHPAPTAPPVEPTPAATASSSPAPDQEILIEASVRDPILPPGEAQEVRVRLLLPSGDPVVGASVEVRILGASRDREVALAPTRKDGSTSGSWSDPGRVPGEIVTVVVRASHAGAEATVRIQYAHGFGEAP